MSLGESREILTYPDRGQSPCPYVREVLDHQVAEIDQRLAELVVLREQLVTRASTHPTATYRRNRLLLRHYRGCPDSTTGPHGGGGLLRSSRPPRGPR